MPKRAAVRQINGLERRGPKRQKSSNSRWKHLSVADCCFRESLQLCLKIAVLGCVSYNWDFQHFIALRLLIIEDMVNTTNPNAVPLLDTAIRAMLVNLDCYVDLVKTWYWLDHIRHDITPQEQGRPLKYKEDTHLQIDDLDDLEAITLTRFSVSELRRLYICFDLDGYLLLTQEDCIRVPTNGRNQRGRQCYYRFDPETLFLFTMAKLASGDDNKKLCNNTFGGHEIRFSYGYPWMLRYLDRRYEGIIGHGGLWRYVDQFDYFHNKIERFVAEKRMHHRPDGTAFETPGLKFLPFDIFGFIDGTIDKICTPFSGPDGDFIGAPRKENYDDAQRAFYTGYKKFHGIRMLVVILPNGLCFCFGPVSARRADGGVLAMCGLNEFLEKIQAGKAFIFKAFGDNAFGLGLSCICSYFRPIGPHVELTEHEKTCNHNVSPARQFIELYFGSTSSLFKICDTRESNKLGKKIPYAAEQLRVVHLMQNCYNCLHGDKTAAAFKCVAPALEAYLEL